ncbi:hypothetical protein ACLB2K_070486 [Fragaria x ananassa]
MPAVMVSSFLGLDFRDFVTFFQVIRSGGVENFEDDGFGRRNELGERRPEHSCSDGNGGTGTQQTVKIQIFKVFSSLFTEFEYKKGLPRGIEPSVLSDLDYLLLERPWVSSYDSDAKSCQENFDKGLLSSENVGLLGAGSLLGVIHGDIGDVSQPMVEEKQLLYCTSAKNHGTDYKDEVWEGQKEAFQENQKKTSTGQRSKMELSRMDEIIDTLAVEHPSVASPQHSYRTANQFKSPATCSGFANQPAASVDLKDLINLLRRDVLQTGDVLKEVFKWDTVSKDLVPIIEQYQEERSLVLNAGKFFEGSGVPDYAILMQSISQATVKEHHSIQKSRVILFQIAEFVNSFQYHRHSSSKGTTNFGCLYDGVMLSTDGRSFHMDGVTIDTSRSANKREALIRPTPSPSLRFRSA